MTAILNESVHSCPRPAPVFNLDSQSFSTKKQRLTPKSKPPPKLPIKSCPVTRIFVNRPRVSSVPLPVSFRIDADTSFIAQSPIYQSQQQESYFEQCYDIEAKLGVGSFGEVYRVRCKEDGRIYACKKTLIKFRGDSDRRRRLAEVDRYQKLPYHSNCVQFYRAWEERQHLYILTEACQHSLADRADSTSQPVSESLLWNYALDLLQGVEHLHNNSLVHMDIKPENIFISNEGVCKLGDFGLMFDMSRENMSEAMEGDPLYMAPECLSSQFGPAADMFSLGISLLELALDLDLPAQGPTWHALREGSLPDSVNALSPCLQQLLRGLLEPAPEKRLSATQALALPSLVRLMLRRRLVAALQSKVQTVSEVLMQSLWWLLGPLTRRVRDTARYLTQLVVWATQGSRQQQLQQQLASQVTPENRRIIATPRHLLTEEFSLAQPLERRDVSTEHHDDALRSPQHHDSSCAQHYNSTPLHPGAFRRRAPPLVHSECGDENQNDGPLSGRPLPQFGSNVGSQTTNSSSQNYSSHITSSSQSISLGVSQISHHTDPNIKNQNISLFKTPSTDTRLNGVSKDGNYSIIPNCNLSINNTFSNTAHSLCCNDNSAPLKSVTTATGQSLPSSANRLLNATATPHGSRPVDRGSYSAAPIAFSSTSAMSVQPRRLFGFTDGEGSGSSCPKKEVLSSPATGIVSCGVEERRNLHRQQQEEDEAVVAALTDGTSRKLIDLFNSSEFSDSE
uniref:non-specific serine/threonine protein kinase n=1 Tax=Hirondellea gigas TaxID=1518452 RepID=A0A6A7FTT7_9CRUS